MATARPSSWPALLLLLLTCCSIPTSSIDLLFNGFESSDLVLYGNASLESFSHSSVEEAQSHRRRYLSLTTETNFSIGRALLPFPLRAKSPDSSAAVLPFAASFVFSIAPVEAVFPGHGFAFLFVPAVGTLGAISAQHLGLFNLSSNGDPASHVLAVEFDLFRNQEFQDINANHVGIDRNSLTSVEAVEAGYWRDGEGEESAAFVGLALNDGSNYQAWVDYAGGRLNVTMAPAALGRKPSIPLISVEMDLSDVFFDEMYVGFCAATGVLVERHLILAWSFSNSNFSAGDGLITSDLPNFKIPSHASSRKGLIVAFSIAGPILMISIAAGTWMWMSTHRNRKRSQGIRLEFNREKIEKWELDYWPRRIRYQELFAATDGFSERNLLAHGGHSVVYQGVLGGTQVAIKVLSHTTEEEAKQFAAEVSTLGRLKHRNLIGLRGWCRARGMGGSGDAMITIYNYMENGSLDRWIFGARESLDWGSRVRILRNVAAAVLYLHEGWGEAVVLHRDIKASNVMLDSAMAGRLGDFGLARFHLRGQALGTSRVVGSPGYLAPEVMHNGRATTSTDVYAFGVLALEVASGRRAVEEGRPPLVAWAREACSEVATVVDEKARASKGYDEGEAMLVVTVGLACTQEDPARRPTIREVVRMMEAAGEEGNVSNSMMRDIMLEAAMSSGKAWVWQPPSKQRYLTFEELRGSIHQFDAAQPPAER